MGRWGVGVGRGGVGKLGRRGGWEVERGAKVLQKYRPSDEAGCRGAFAPSNSTHK